MQEITSVNNPLIKKVHLLQQKKFRNEYGLFLIEGYKGVIEALESGVKIKNIFIKQGFDRLLADFDENDIYRVSESVLNKISATDSPPDIVATAYKLKFKIEDIFKTDNPLVIILESIKDPGNLGTIIRTAVAAYASGIILTDETVDIYNPKTVRSSAANLWKIPIIFMPDKENIKKNLNKYVKNQFVATTIRAKSQEIYCNIDFKKPTVIMFGSEAEGLSDELISQADKLVTIPMNEQVESLNLSISVGVILYESVKQRKYVH